MQAAKSIIAHAECSNKKLQKVLRRMLKIANDQKATLDERDLAINTIADILFGKRN